MSDKIRRDHLERTAYVYVCGPSQISYGFGQAHGADARDYAVFGRRFKLPIGQRTDEASSIHRHSALRWVCTN